MTQKTVSLEEILFNELDKYRVAFPDENLYSREEIKESSEFIYFINAMKEACKQTLDLASKKALVFDSGCPEEPSSKIEFPDNEDIYTHDGFYITTDKQSILDVINLIE